MKFRRQSTPSRKNDRRHKKQFGWVPVRGANSLGGGSILGHQRLEERIALAWDTTLGLATTANVSMNTAGTTTTFTATGTGANVDWADVESQLANGFNVVVNTGSTGTTEAGDITDQTGAILGGLASNVSLSFQSGSGAGLVGNISLKTETLGGTDDSFIIDAAGAATSTGAGALSASNLTVTASAGINLNTSVSDLTATDNTSGDITITQVSAPAQALTVTGTGVVNNTGTGTIDVTNLGSSITVDGGSEVKSTNGTITLAATGLTLTGTVNAGTGGVSLNASGAVTIQSTVTGTSPTLTGGTSLLVDYTGGASLPDGLAFSTASPGASLTLSDKAGAAADAYDITSTDVTRDGATPVTYSGIAQINVTGSNDDDTLTVDNSGGLIAPTIDFTGGKGTNSLIVTGNKGTGVSAVYNDTGSDATGFSGNVTSTQSATTETIDFTGLSPVEYLTPTSLLTINMAAGANVENIVAGPTSTGIDPILGTTAPTYQVNYGGGGEPVNWRNATTVDVVGSTSADVITENLPTKVDAGSPNQLTTLNIDGNGTSGGGIVDEVDVLATPGGVTTSTDDKATNLNDRVVVGSTLASFDNGTGTLANISGAINVTDSALIGGGTAALLVDDSGGTGPDTATVTSTAITVGSRPAIGYDSTIDEAIEVALTAKADTFNVRSTNAGVATTILLGNAGDDTFNVSSTAPAVNGNGTRTGNLSGIQGQLDIRGDAGTNTLNVSDYSGPSGQTYAISILVATITQISATGSGHILYNNGDPSGIANLNLTGSSAGHNTYNIDSTTTTNETKVDDGDSSAGAGGSTFNINGANLGAANTFDGHGGNDTFNVTNSLVPSATLNIDGGSGTNQLKVPSADFNTPTGPGSGKVGTTAGGNDVVTTYANIADTLAAVGTVAISATEGTTFAGTALATFTTSYTGNVASHFSATIDWGDGTSSAGTVSGTGNGTLTVSGSHLYTDELAAGAASVALSEDAPGTATATATGTANVADADTLATVGTLAISATEATTFTSTALATFTTTYTANAASDFAATINWGDGTSSAGTVSGTGDGTLTVSGSHLYSEELASAPISVTLSDNAPGTATATATGTANVADAPLSATAVAITSPEFANFSGVVATFTDADPNGTATDYTATIAWGDGVTSAGIIAASGGGFKVSGSHAYGEDATYTITVTVADAGGSTATAGAAANITEQAISATAVAVNGYERSPLANVALATFTHGTGGEPTSGFSVTIEWGDGTTSTGSVSESGTTYTVLGSHTYLDEGTYPIAFQVFDGSGSSSFTTTATLKEELLTNGTVGTVNQRFIQEVYRDLLHRQVDDLGLAYWTNLLDQGETRLQVVTLIISDAMQGELAADLVTGIYEKYLGREPDAAGLAAWVPILGSQQETIEQVEANIAGSPEFFAQSGGTNSGFITHLFNLALERNPEPAALSGLNAILAAGTTREQVAELVFSSPEFHRDEVAGYYQSSNDLDGPSSVAVPFIDDLDFLDRPADPLGLAGFAAELDAGVRDQVIWADFMASDEFFAKIA